MSVSREESSKRAVAAADKARAALAEAQAGRESAELNLGYTEIRAPIDGTVGNRSARPGAFATVGAQLMSLVPARDLWIDAGHRLGRRAEGPALELARVPCTPRLRGGCGQPYGIVP